VGADRWPGQLPHPVWQPGYQGRLTVLMEQRKSAEKKAVLSQVAPLALGRAVHPAVGLSRPVWVARSAHPGRVVLRLDQLAAGRMQERLAVHLV
jgi:hypothetical protein